MKTPSSDPLTALVAAAAATAVWGAGPFGPAVAAAGAGAGAGSLLPPQAQGFAPHPAWQGPAQVGLGGDDEGEMSDDSEGPLPALRL